MFFRPVSASTATAPRFFACAFRAVTLLFCALPALALAQVRPIPGDGGIIITPPGGGIVPPGGGVTPPIIINPPGGGANPGGPSAVITAPRGAIVGDTVNATATLAGVATATPPATGNTTTTPTTYQWTINGGRLTGDSRAATTQFVADRPGTVTLNVSILSSAGAFNASTNVTILAADAAGAVTAPATISASTTSITASVPAAQNNDRTFRWTVSGDATITAGQNTRSITLRPGTPGLKEIVCNVTLQNLVSVPVRAHLVVTGTGPATALTINNGTGGGTYPAGSRVDIFADPPAAGQVFDRWTGETQVLGAAPLAALLPHTVITVPATPITLTATYKPAPAWTPVTFENFNPQTQPAAAGQPATSVSTTLIYHVPENPAGLVFLLHDTAGSAQDWLSQPEQLLLVRELVAAGYGVAALNSLNRTTATWAAQTTLPTNLDALNHAAAHDRILRETTLTAAKPLFFLGLAAGADAAQRYADLLARGATGHPARPVKGVVLYLSAGSDALAVTSRVPHFYALAANDPALGAAGLLAARDNAQLLLGRGVAQATTANAISPVHPGRFRALRLRTPTFSNDEAQTIWSAVKSTGVLDENNYVKSLPTDTALAAALPLAHRERTPEVAAQLAVAAAAKAFYSDANPRVLQFLNNRAADAPVPQPGRIVNLSARGKVAHLTDTYTVGFTLTGPARATLLLRAVGPTLTRFGVRDPLLAPRLDLNQGTRVLASNEGWEKNQNAAQLPAITQAVGAFALPAGALDAALLVQLDAGTYTATIRGLGGTTGDVLAEIYDLSRNATRLTNLSTLTRIHHEGDLLIPGLVIAGNNPRTLVARAVSAGLTDFGYTSADVLGDPRLAILQGNQTVAQNNNWTQPASATLAAVFPAIGAFPLRAAADAALLDALTPGTYTLQAGPAPVPQAPAGTTLIAPNPIGALLLEVYEVP